MYRPSSYREINKACPNCAHVFVLVAVEGDPVLYCHKKPDVKSLYWDDEVEANGICDEWEEKK